MVLRRRLRCVRAGDHPRAPACSRYALFRPSGEAVELEGLGGGGVVASAFGDQSVAGLAQGVDHGGADGGEVGWGVAAAGGVGVFAEGDVADVVFFTSMCQCWRATRARSAPVACSAVRSVTA